MQARPSKTTAPALLPIHLHRKLELSGIIGRGGLSSIGPELVHSGHIEFVSDVKDIRDQVQIDPFAEVNAAGNAKVVEHRPRLYRGVAGEVAI